MSARPLRCLVVEDDAALRRDVVYFLGRHGIVADGANDGAELDRRLAVQTYDVLVLDLGLPGEDGLSVARRLSGRAHLGLIMLTARDQLQDRLAGWQSGAHVYLVKPVPLAELAAVVVAVHRRLQPQVALSSAPSWRLPSSRRELITPEGVAIPLTYREHLLLKAMASAPAHRISRDLALGQEIGASVDGLVHRLRRKLSNHGDPIRTLYGEGLQFDARLELPEARDADRD